MKRGVEFNRRFVRGRTQRLRLAALAPALLFGLLPNSANPQAASPTTATSSSGAETSNPPDVYLQQLRSARELEKRAYFTKSTSDYRAAAAALEACAAVHPEDVSLQTSLAELYSRLHDPQKAYPHVKAIYAATPDAAGWAQTLADVAGQTGHFDVQIQVLHEIVRQNPNDPWCRVDLGDALAKTGQRDAAEEAYRDALSLAPDQEWINIEYAKSLLSDAKSSAAQEIVTKVLAKNPKSAAAIALQHQIDQANSADYARQLQSAQLLEARAEQSHSVSDYRTAADALQACSMRHPSDVGLHRELGFLYLEKLNQPELAYPHLQAVYANSPDAPGWGQMLARAAAETGRPELQIGVLTDIARRSPKDPWCQLDLAEAYNKNHQFAEADEHYQDAVNIAPNEQWVNIPYAQFLLARGRAADAERIAKNVLISNPQSVAAKSILNQTAMAAASDPSAGRSAIFSGYAAQLQAARQAEAVAYQTRSPADFSAAADALDACSAAHPEDIGLHRSLGYLYLEKLNEPKLAFKHLAVVYAATPNAPSWGQMLAQDARELGRTDVQIQVLRDMVWRNPNDPWRRLDLADALAKSDRPATAKLEYLKAVNLAPQEEWVCIPYARYLYAQHDGREARQVAQAVLTTHPQSATALAIMGDVDRDNFELTRAEAEYNQARVTDPNYYAARIGLNEIAKIRSPQVKSVFYLFDGTDHFHQTGLFNTLTVPIADHVFANATFNALWFSNNLTPLGTISRIAEGASLEDRVNSGLSLQAGVSGFEVKDHDIAGFNVGGTVIPSQQLWAYGSFRLNDPVDDSVATVANGLKQDLVGISSGYQATKELDAKINASHAFYSDGNGRNFVHAETAYTLWHPAELKIGGAYEVLDYQRHSPTYPSPHFFQTFGPLIEIEPSLTSYLSVHLRYEEVFITETSEWGELLTVGPTLRVADKLECSAEYLYVNYPGTDLNYSGNGFRVSLSYRF